MVQSVIVRSRTFVPVPWALATASIAFFGWFRQVHPDILRTLPFVALPSNRRPPPFRKTELWSNVHPSSVNETKRAATPPPPPLVPSAVLSVNVELRMVAWWPLVVAVTYTPPP